LPQVPRGLVGLMNHRGEILPVVDLGPWLGIPVVPRLQVMVVDGGEQQLGIAVDAIHDLLDLAPDSVEAAGKGADDTGLGEALAPLAGVPGPGGGDTHPWLVRPGVLIERLAETFATHPEAA
ncbi:MAG: chemotaxis protein CheW, partial [Nitrospirae bacterium]